MRDMIPGEPLKDLLTDFYRDMHGVVDYVTISTECRPEDALDGVHWLVALFGMRVIDWRTNEFFKVKAQERSKVFYELFWCGLRFDDLSPSSFLQLNVDDKMMASEVEDQESFMRDYRYAFFKPPYGLSGGSESAERLFGDINKTLLGDLSRWTIRRWSSDWSSCFEPGNDWWGAFLWTLVKKNGREAVWIGASTTD